MSVLGGMVAIIAAFMCFFLIAIAQVARERAYQQGYRQGFHDAAVHRDTSHD